jgi:hypothetical protein
VLTNVPVNINDLFGSHVDDILLIFDWPTGDLWTQVASDFDILIPGRAYLLVNRNPGDSYTIEFPDFDPAAPHIFPQTKDNITAVNSPWNKVENTSQPHIILFDDEALFSLEPGDIIGAFDNTNTCYGVAEYEGIDSFFKLIVMGDNPLTEKTDGFVAGERMKFNLYRQRTGESFEITFEYDETYPSSDGLYAVNGVSRVVAVNTGVTAVEQIVNSYNVNVFPNPAVDIVNIVSDYTMKQIVVINHLGQTVVSIDPHARNIQLDVSALTPGMYILRIRANDGAVIIKRLSVR